MKIEEFLSRKAIGADIKAVKKEDVLRDLVDLLIASGDIDKKYRAKLVEQLMAREAPGFNRYRPGSRHPAYQKRMRE